MNYKVTVKTDSGSIHSAVITGDLEDSRKYWENVYNEYKDKGILRQTEMNNLGLTLIDVKPN